MRSLRSIAASLLPQDPFLYMLRLERELRAIDRGDPMTQNGDTEISGHMAHGESHCSGCGCVPEGVHTPGCPVLARSLGVNAPEPHSPACECVDCHSGTADTRPGGGTIELPPPEPHPTGMRLNLEKAGHGFIAWEGSDSHMPSASPHAFSTLDEALAFAKRYLEG